ncbi:MAG: hypothetical protein V7642_5283 [Burkholderiales bacterium]
MPESDATRLFLKMMDKLSQDPDWFYDHGVFVRELRNVGEKLRCNNGRFLANVQIKATVWQLPHDLVRGKPRPSGRGQERGRQSRSLPLALVRCLLLLDVLQPVESRRSQATR